MPSWCRLLRQAAVRPRSLVRDSTGSSIAARRPMMAITTSSSINVNARCLDTENSGLPAAADLPLHFLEQRREFGLGCGGAVRIKLLHAQGADLVLQFGTQRRRAGRTIIADTFVDAGRPVLLQPLDGIINELFPLVRRQLAERLQGLFETGRQRRRDELPPLGLRHRCEPFFPFVAAPPF